MLNVTWLQDPNLAETNNFGVEGIDAQGRMSWDTANAWIAAMNAANYLGFDDWRLPHILPVNGITYNYEFSFIGLTDYGWNVSAPGSAYEGSTGSEMAYMYYNNLLNLGYYDVYGNSPQEGCCLANTTPFIGIGVGYHWSGTVHGLWPPNVMTFDFYGGGQFYNGPGEYFFVWPGRDGDVVCA